jgi:hypothetical protein
MINYCDKCQGRKVYASLGQIYKDCEECAGLGYKVTPAVVEKVVEIPKKVEKEITLILEDEPIQHSDEVIALNPHLQNLKKRMRKTASK